MDEYSFISENGTVRQIRDLVAKAKDEEQDARLDYLEQTAIIDAYSETETQTNKRWIDGKPIYRKVLVMPTAVPVSDVAYHSLGVSFPAGTDTEFLPMVVSIYGNMIYYSSYHPLMAAAKVSVNIPAGTKIIIEYTKA